MKIKATFMALIMVILLCFTNLAIIYASDKPVTILYATYNPQTNKTEKEIIVINNETEQCIKINKDDNRRIDNCLIEKEEYIGELLSYNIPSNKGFKTFMTYDLFNDNTPQFQLQQIAYTNSDGIRSIDYRYCIAIGTYFDTPIGQYIDLILENGTIIPCIVGDKKAPQHTEKNNIFSLGSGCASEFIVDTSAINDEVKKRGDMSFNKTSWASPVACIRVYKRNVLDENNNLT